MILIDSRTGSSDLIPHFRQFGVHVESTFLEFGDAAFCGNGPDGEVSIGVERKNLNDLIQSMRSRRLSGHQLPGLVNGYDYVYLIVEGVYRPGPKGLVEVFYYGWKESRERISYREIDSYLNTLAVKAGVIVLRSEGPNETATQIFSLYKWWGKGWDEHTAHSQVYAPPPERKKAGWIQRNYSLVEKMAVQIPGIDRRGEKVGRTFRTPIEMVGSGMEGWKRAGLGKVMAERVYKLMRGL